MATSLRNATLYADVRQQLRVVARMQSVRSNTLHALLRSQPGYQEAAAGKNKYRVRWFLRTMRRLPAELVVQYVPIGCVGAVELLSAALPNERGTWVPRIAIEQLCVLVLELAPLAVQMHMD